MSPVNHHQLFEVEFLEDTRTPSLVCGDTSSSRKKLSYFTLADYHSFQFSDLVKLYIFYMSYSSHTFINRSVIRVKIKIEIVLEDRS